MIEIIQDSSRLQGVSEMFTKSKKLNAINATKTIQ